MTVNKGGEKMRKTIIAGNWKMHKTLSEAVQFLNEIKNQAPDSSKVETIVCAPFPFLPALVEHAKNSPVKVAAQNMHFEENGAYTGEVSPVMLKDLGVSHCVIGHSERREYFAETDEAVNKKVKAAHQHGIIPIVCVGETLEQREAGDMKGHIEHQVKQALLGLSHEEIAVTIIAYEPIWAIGTGKTASDAEANEACSHIRTVVSELSDQGTGERLIIQYGGSVKPDNISGLLAETDIDGALVGGASLEPQSFVQLLKAGLQ